MTVKAKIASENVHTLLKELRRLPRKDTGYTREEAVAYLREEILAAARKGYSFQELRKMFREHGVTVALAPVLSGSRQHAPQTDGSPRGNPVAAGQQNSGVQPEVCPTCGDTESDAAPPKNA